MKQDLNGYPTLSVQPQQQAQQKNNIEPDYINAKDAYYESVSIPKDNNDINGYPEVGNQDSVIKKKESGLEIKPITKIIYQTGGGAVDIATRTRLGIVKIGKDLDITAQGTLSAAVHIENLLQNEIVVFNCGTSTTVI